MENAQKVQKVNELIKEIQSSHTALIEGEQKSDTASREIGKNLLKIEREELYKLCKDKNGKAISTMAKFIKANFSFSYQNGIMLKQSARVQEMLGLDEKVSFRLLRSLNRYTNNESAMIEIWNDAVKNSQDSIPCSKQLRNSIHAWEQNHPADAFRKTKTMKMSSIEDALKNESVTLKEICSILAKQDLANISSETENELIAKIKELLHPTTNIIKAA